MNFVQKGIYYYADCFEKLDSSILPGELQVSNRMSNEAVLIRLLSGTLKIKYTTGEIVQNTNYSISGTSSNGSFNKNIIKDFFSFDHFRKVERKNIDTYLKANRKNYFIHSEMLSELTSAIVWLNSSPIESFVHIYRTLEFMSYSFPMIYASKSMDYRGSYEHLKKFMNGDSDGELKFFKTFLKELFKNNILFDYEFEIGFLNGDEDLIRQELGRIIPSNISYTFEDYTMKIRFANIIDLVITLRNRYFHMLLGKGTDNFYDIKYDKRKLFEAVNPVFINWLTMIYKEIVVYSIGIV